MTLNEEFVNAEVINQGVKKILLEEAHGDIGYLVNGTKFDSSYDRNDPLKFVLYGKQVIRGFDDSVATMKEGEKAKFFIRSDYAYGSEQASELIPPNSDLIFEIKLLSIDKKKDKNSLSILERVNEAIKAKEEGNRYYKDQEFEKAKSEYLYAIDLVNDYESWTNELKDVARENIITYYINYSQCLIKLENYFEAAIYANNALKLDSKNFKAIYRYAFAEFKKGNTDIAYNAIKDVSKSSKELTALYNEIVKQLNKEKHAEANFYKKSFKF